jgi:hypothetical protein
LRYLSQDKVVLKLFATTVEAGKLERALDLVERLHLEKSFDLAMVLADNHRRLVDLIEDAKERKFGGDDDDDSVESPPPEYSTLPEVRQRISPDGSARKRSLQGGFDGARQVRVRQA